MESTQTNIQLPPSSPPSISASEQNENAQANP